MAEDLAQLETDDGNDSLEFAAEQITALMGGAGTGEQPATPDPEPAQQAQAPAEADPAPVAAPVVAEAAPVAAAPAPVAQAQAAPVAPQTAPAAAAPQAPAPDKLVEIGNAVAETLSQRLQAQFPDIKTQADLTHIMRTDAGRYNEFVVAKMELDQEIGRIAATIHQHRQAETLSKQEQETQRAQARAVEGEKLGKLIPDLTDPAKGPKLVADLRKYAEANEIAPDRLANYTAKEFEIAHKAMLYDAAKAAEASSLEAANKKASKAPPVQQPGTRIPGNGKAEKMQESFTRLQKTGREDDAAAVFAQLLS